MAFPTSTKIWEETMDPYDVVDFAIDLSPLLEATETIASYIVDPLPESELYGLTVGSGPYAPVLEDATLTLWLSVSSGFQSDPAFVNGLTLPIEISVTTDSSPPRKRQRTVAVTVIQR